MSKSRIFRQERSIGRKAGYKKPRLKIFAYCEGKNTEPDYLKDYKKEYGNGLVEVEVVRAAGSPKTIVEAAADKSKELKKKAKRTGDSLDLKFQVWAVFDRDEHPRISEAFVQAGANGIMVAYSNPCFELWPYLHYVDQCADIHRHDLQKKLEGVMEGYDSKGSKKVDISLLADKFEVAKKRALKLKESHESAGSPMAAPYTDIYILLDLIKENGKS